jgi:hypothetical protein
MTVAEIIELIRKLPREEQERLFSALKEMVDKNEVLHDEPSVRFMDAGKAKAVSSEIFAERAELFRKLAS